MEGLSGCEMFLVGAIIDPQSTIKNLLNTLQTLSDRDYKLQEISEIHHTTKINKNGINDKSTYPPTLVFSEAPNKRVYFYFI